MRDNADQTLVVGKLLQYLYRIVQGSAVQRAEALVDEHRLKLYAAGALIGGIVFGLLCLGGAILW